MTGTDEEHRMAARFGVIYPAPIPASMKKGGDERRCEEAHAVQSRFRADAVPVKADVREFARRSGVADFNARCSNWTELTCALAWNQTHTAAAGADRGRVKWLGHGGSRLALLPA